MKTLITLFTIILFHAFSFSQSPLVGLVLEEIDNGGAVPGTTYRLYAELSEGILYVMYGDESNLI